MIPGIKRKKNVTSLPILSSTFSNYIKTKRAAIILKYLERVTTQCPKILFSISSGARIHNMIPQSQQFSRKPNNPGLCIETWGNFSGFSSHNAYKLSYR